jgi:hypothetical protein
MKKIIIFLFSVILTMNYVTLFANAHIMSDSCNFRFILWDDAGFGWWSDSGIEITVDGVDYGFVNLPLGTANAEETIALPAGEVQLFWIGTHLGRYHFEVYNSSNELIYTSYGILPGGWFFTYQNECPECLPIADFEGVYIQEENQVNLSWQAPEATALIGFDIYRNDILIEHVAPTIIFYSDSTANLESGDYKYCVVPVYPFVCDLEDKCFETPINVGIKNYEDHIMIYPNPAKEELTITNYELQITNVELLDVYGRNVSSHHLISKSSHQINVSHLPAGMYFIKIVSEQGSVTKKVVVER